MGIFGFFNKEKKETLDKGLEKTKSSVFDKLTRAVAGKSKVDDDVLDNLEEVLITSDVGVDTTLKIIERIEERVARDKYVSTSELNGILKDEIAALLAENNTEDNDNWELPGDHKPYVILVVGVNGVGKTTTIGKLAWQFKQAGKKVYLGAADTFRAAAVEQLCIWGERVGVPVIKQQMGSDPASVAFDTLSSAKANEADVVLIDTAGRLHNKVGLMNELKKIKDVMKKVLPEAPDEVMLVLDGSTGQNAFEQAKQFSAVTQITSLGACGSTFFMTSCIFFSSFISPTLLCRRPAVSISTTSASLAFALCNVSKATEAGSEPICCLMTGTPTRSPQMHSCSTAAARKVSAAPKYTFFPACLNCQASFPIVVVLPTPFTPTTSMT